MQLKIKCQTPDSDRLKGGQSYSELRDSYIIFICNYDPFGWGKAVYRFQYTEKDEKDLYLGDGMYKIPSLTLN